MIKKINIILILTSILGSLYFVFTRDNNIVLILKDLSIIITINALYIIRKLFKLKISDVLIFIYVLFIFLAHFLGVICELYNVIYWYDKFTHFLSGVLTSFGAIFLLKKFKKSGNTIFSILFIIALSLMVASLWEIFEYLSSFYLGVDPQKVAQTGVADTMGDIIVAFLGSILVSIGYQYEYKCNYDLLIKRFVNLI